MDKDSKSPEKLSSKSESTDNADDNDTEDSNTSENSKENREESSKENRRASLFADQVEEDNSEKTEKKSWLDSSVELLGVNDESKDKSIEPNDVELDEESGLSEAEVQEVTEMFVDSRNEELSAELSDADDDSVDELEVLADIAFLESLREKLENGEDLSEDLINDAYTDTAKDLGVEHIEVDESDIDAQESEHEKLTENIDEAEVSEELIDEPEDEDHNTVVPPSPPVPPTPPTPPTRPPSPPLSPIPPTPSSRQYPTPPVQPNLNQQNLNSGNANNQNTVIHYIDRRRRGRDLLIGGIVGYVIGRRGGRKRTEKKVIPKNRKTRKRSWHTSRYYHRKRRQNSQTCS